MTLFIACALALTALSATGLQAVAAGGATLPRPSAALLWGAGTLAAGFLLPCWLL